MAIVGSILDGLGRFIAAAFGGASNTFSESKALREEIAKEQEAEKEKPEPS